MHLKCQSTDANYKFDKASQIESVPIELLTLVNFVLEGSNLYEKGHGQSKEKPFPLYIAIKIYSHSRSKTMINWLDFCAGILISYNQLLDKT